MIIYLRCSDAFTVSAFSKQLDNHRNQLIQVLLNLKICFRDLILSIVFVVLSIVHLSVYRREWILKHSRGEGTVAEGNFWLMQLELILSSATVVVALFSLVAGIFGMNIPYEWNTGHADYFTWVRTKLSYIHH